MMTIKQAHATRWQERVTYRDAGPEPQVLLDDGQVKVVVCGLRPGQQLPVHPEGKSVFSFLEGQGQMMVDDQTFAVSPGSIVLVPPGGRRGIRAETQLAFLAVRVK